MYRLILTFLFTLLLWLAVYYSWWSRGRQGWDDYQWPVVPVSMTVFSWIGAIASAGAMVHLDWRRRSDPNAFPLGDVLRPLLIAVLVCSLTVVFYASVAAFVEFRRPYFSKDSAYFVATALFGGMGVLISWRLLHKIRRGRILWASREEELTRVGFYLGQALCVGWVYLMTRASLALELNKRTFGAPRTFDLWSVIFFAVFLSSPAIVGIALFWRFQRRIGRPKREPSGFPVLPPKSDSKS